MKRSRALDQQRRFVLALAGGLTAALGASPAIALPSCSVAALNALGVPNVSIKTATTNAANVCVATGTVATSGFGAPDGSAGFQVQLPLSGWNSKFVFLGVGGFAGSFTGPATNAGDPVAAAAERFAVAVTDTGPPTRVGRCWRPASPTKRKLPTTTSAPLTR